jgi:uncharacterized membrane protein
VRFALASAAILWFAAILIAPFAIDSTHGVSATGAACVYVAGSFVCHQRPERSFSLAGRQMPVCARCAGLYAAAAAFSACAFAFGVTSSARTFRLGTIGPVTAARARWIALVAALPTMVTWVVEHLGFVHLSNTTRFLASLPLGSAVMWLLIGVLPGRRRP